MRLIEIKYKNIVITEQDNNTHCIVFTTNDKEEADVLYSKLFQKVKLDWEYKQSASFLVIEIILLDTHEHFYAAVDISDNTKVLEWFKNDNFTHMVVFYLDGVQKPTLFETIIPL